MNGSEFERFIRRLLPKVSYSYKNIKGTYNYKSKETKGPVDLFSYQEESNKYVAIVCTTQSSGLKAKILSDIESLTNENCHIRNDIEHVVICVSNIIKTEEIEYRNKCKNYGWTAEIYSLDSLVYLATEHPDISDDLCAEEIQEISKRNVKQQGSTMIADEKPHKNDTKEIEYTHKIRMYDCGNRIKEIRSNLDYSTSRFIELIDIHSEKSLVTIEDRVQEASTEVINSISNKTGVSVRWLKHGEGEKFESDSISTWGLDKLDVIKSWNPQSLYFLINKESMSLVMLAHLHDLNWKIFDFSFTLDFWNWWGDEKYIPEIYDLLNRFSKEFGQCPYGRILSNEEYSEITSGNIHPSLFLNKTNTFGMNWFDDLQDIHHKYPISSNYEEWYGEWFIKIQSYFKKYSK
jgi:hypothetical protein